MAVKSFFQLLCPLRHDGGSLPEEALDRIEELLENCAHDGRGHGFGISIGGRPYIETAQFAASLLAVLAQNGRDRLLEKYREGLRGWILRLSKRDGGGFGDDEQGKAMIFSTFYAVTALRMLDRLDETTRKESAAYLNDLVRRDAVPRHEGEEPDMTNLYWTVIAAKAARVPLGDARIPAFVGSCRVGDAMYANRPRLGARLVPTAHAVVIRSQLGTTFSLAGADRIRRFLLALRTPEDEFVDVRGEKPTPLSTMCGAVALHLLGETTRRCNAIRTDDLWLAHASVTAMLACNAPTHR